MLNDISVGTGTAHSECHEHKFTDDLAVYVDCTLKQNDEVVSGFLHCDEDAELVVEVELTGHLADHLCGFLCVAAHIECYGPADPEPLPRPEQQEFNCNNKELTFTIPIPAGHIPCGGDEDEDCGQVCCFAVSVTSRTKCDKPGHIGCYCKGPCVMVHREPHPEHDDEGA